VTDPKRANMYAQKCRNGHRRTAENTYLRPGGARQCTDCPGWQRSQLGVRARQGLAPKPRAAEPEKLAHHYHRVLSAAELGYLRSLIPCVQCAAPFGSAHSDACSVPYNREDDGTVGSAVPSRKRAA
jgi:hypothetical protein